MISCLIFDLDGTLFDSSAANVASYAKAFAEAGVVFDEKRYHQNFGLRFNEMIDTIAPTASADQRHHIKDLKAKFYRDHLNMVKPNADLIAFLKDAKRHYRTALVTTAAKTNSTNLLSHFALDKNVFDVIISGEDVKQGKPDPECYTLAVQKLAARPEECLVFEDSQIGIAAAQAAGTKVVKVAM